LNTDTLCSFPAACPCTNSTELNALIAGSVQECLTENAHGTDTPPPDSAKETLLVAFNSMHIATGGEAI
jgi:hypothetical protein